MAGSNIRQGIWEEAAGGEVAVSFAKLTHTTILGHTTAPTTWPVALHGLYGPARYRVLHDKARLHHLAEDVKTRMTLFHPKVGLQLALLIRQHGITSCTRSSQH